MMSAPFVHRIDPVLGGIGGVYFWWYGLSYAAGFLQMHLYVSRHRDQLRLTGREVYALSLCIAIGVLAGGRAIEVAFDEWPFYRQHPGLIPALWLGGMATHGLLLGAAAGAALLSWAWRRPFLELADLLVIPGAFLMGIGRIGNFIDGLIVGAPTDVWWGVQFPDAVGARHPVVLYDGVKNLLLIPYLLRVRKTNPTPGAAAARFVFWYAFLRMFIDLFRDYPTHRLALGTGQTLNIVMTALGVVLLVRSRLRRLGRLAPRHSMAERPDRTEEVPPSWLQRSAFAALLLFCLTIPSNWTQDVPARYGKRHPGLEYGWLYLHLDTSPRGSGTQGLRSSRPGPAGVLRSRPRYRRVVLR
jgi:phosphatidylglycerol:prolipoprotein diacylglycerol transferase